MAGTLNMAGSSKIINSAFTGVSGCSGVYIKSTGEFNMYDSAEIRDCYDGGVTNQGTIKMYGDSAITNCTGSGIKDEGQMVRMSDNSKISGCTATGSLPDGCGGGIYDRNSYVSNDIVLSGNAQISNCTASKLGGGVYIVSGTFSMLDNSMITGCSISATGATGMGGGAYIHSATFTMSGGSIQNCEATGDGGGVYLVSSTFNLMGGTIQNCRALTGGGISFIPPGIFYPSFLNVSGSAKVVDNKIRGTETPSNIQLVSDTYVQITGSGLTAGAGFGITPATSPIGTAKVGVVTSTALRPVVPADADFFQADNSAHYITYSAIGTNLVVANLNVPKEPTPNASIDYANEQLTDLVTNGSYTVNGSAKTADGSGKITIESGWFGMLISIVKTGNGTTTSDSTPQALTVPARPAAPTPSVINPTTISGTGTITGLGDTMICSADGTNWIIVAAGTTSMSGLTAGTYYVRVKASGTGFASPIATVTITAFTGTPETTPNASIDYINEQLTGLATNGAYTVGGTAKTADGSGKIPIESAWFNMSKSIVKSGDGIITTNSAVQNLAIPARPTVTTATGHDPTTIGGTGSITGLSDTMEYSTDGSSWTPVAAGTTSIGGLTVGTYYVRIKATSTNFAGTNATVAIAPFGATKETTPAAIADYLNEKLTALTPGTTYIIGGTEHTSDGSGELSISASWFGTNISVVKKGDGITTTNSDAQSITLVGRPTTPIAGTFTVTQPSASGANGTIAGITALMQYTTDGGINWTDGAGSDLTKVDGTTVGIRVKATGAAPCSLTYSISLAYTPASSGGGGGGGSSTPATPIINTNTGSVTGNQLSNAANAAKDGGTVTIKSDKTSEVTLPNSGLASLSGKNNSLTVVTENGTLTFDSKAVGAINTQAAATDIKVIVDNVVKTTLTEEQQTKVGDKTVYDLSVMSGGKLISSFNSGKVKVSIPYDLKVGETAENLKVWYMADNGSLTEINCTYDEKNKAVTFVVDHFSKYIIGYDGLAGWANPFTDVKSSAWYYDAVAFVNTNDLMKGQTDTAFAPQGAMTRGMFVTILGRMEGIDAAVYASINTFSDVKSNQYYAPYIAWANEKGIVSGMGGEKFAPNAAVTREQMAVMMMNYMKLKGQGPAGAWTIQLTYNDLDKVSSWADEAVMFMTMKNLMNGMGNDAKGNPLFAPKSTSTRAQTAQVMMSLGELVK